MSMDLLDPQTTSNPAKQDKKSESQHLKGPAFGTKKLSKEPLGESSLGSEAFAHSSLNIASLIDRQCLAHPHHVAVSALSKAPFWGQSKDWQHLSYGDLKIKSDHLAAKLVDLGLKRGMRTLLFVRPGLDFPVLATALFKIGVTLVMIDPGMGRKNLLKAIGEVKPQALVAVAEVFLGKLLFSSSFSTVQVSVIVNDRWSVGSLFRGPAVDLRSLMLAPGETPRAFQAIDPSSEEICAILFTSGGTGIPKGVLYTHGIFLRQVELIHQLYGVGSEDVDMPCFPLFALFSLALGARVIVPDLDPTKPATADPESLIRTLNDFKVTFAGGSPAIWSKVAQYGTRHSLILPHLRSLMMFGAPVRYHLHDLFNSILSHGTTYTPYGATECLPVASISGREIIEQRFKDRVGEGTCVGKPVPGLEVKIIGATAELLLRLEDARVLKQGEIGEIICKGPQVTLSYYERPDATQKAKIRDSSGVWHRMGDLGWLDQEGRLWFCGRQAYAFSFQNRIFYSVLVEAAFNAHPNVFRSALIQLETPEGIRPAIAIERHDQKVKLSPSDSLIFKNELETLGQSSDEASRIKDFFLVKAFPVDARHNIKIDRTGLGKAVSQGLEGKKL